MDVIKRRSLCRVLPESASHSSIEFRDALSGWGPSGNYDPEYRPKLGCSFPNGLVSENVSQNIGSERDAVSQTGLIRKARPSSRPQNGTQFPPDQPSPPFRHSAARISSSVHRKYMNRCSIHTNLPAHFLSKNFATPKTQLRQGFSCPTVGT